MIGKKLLICASLAILAGCSTVTIHPKQSAELTTEPTYQERKSFYLAGLIGEERVNVSEVCEEKEAVQMQSQQTFVDGLLTVVTLGIYAPHTAKVWCE